jgi:hypothetical protein
MFGLVKMNGILIMQNKRNIWRSLLLPLPIGLLLAPATLTALAWTPLNFLIASVTIIGSVILGIWYKKLRWVIATVVALITAIPPYPYWLQFDNGGHIVLSGHVYFPDPVYSVVVLVIAMGCFKVIFWITDGWRAGQTTA